MGLVTNDIYDKSQFFLLPLSKFIFTFSYSKNIF